MLNDTIDLFFNPGGKYNVFSASLLVMDKAIADVCGLYGIDKDTVLSVYAVCMYASAKSTYTINTESDSFRDIETFIVGHGVNKAKLVKQGFLIRDKHQYFICARAYDLFKSLYHFVKIHIEAFDKLTNRKQIFLSMQLIDPQLFHARSVNNRKK